MWNSDRGRSSTQLGQLHTQHRPEWHNATDGLYYAPCHPTNCNQGGPAISIQCPVARQCNIAHILGKHGITSRKQRRRKANSLLPGRSRTQDVNRTKQGKNSLGPNGYLQTLTFLPLAIRQRLIETFSFFPTLCGSAIPLGSEGFALASHWLAKVRLGPGPVLT